MDDDEVTDIERWHCQGCVEIMPLNPTMTRKGLLGFQGRVAPSEGWCDTFPITDIDENVILDTVQTKLHKVEGWTLFREGRVNGLSSNTVKHYIYFRGQCQASMKQVNYTVYICFKNLNIVNCDVKQTIQLNRNLNGLHVPVLLGSTDSVSTWWLHYILL